MQRVWISSLMLMTLATPALAQRPAVPQAGQNAVTISAGLAVPGEDMFGAGPVFGVAGDHRLSPRVSVRGQFGAAFWRFADFKDDTARPFFLLGSLAYNWDRGVVRPFALAGVGSYSFRLKEVDLGSSDTKFGVHVGAGAEYVLGPGRSLVGELLLHSVSGDAAGRFADYGASFWSLSAGYKMHF